MPLLTSSRIRLGISGLWHVSAVRGPATSRQLSGVKETCRRWGWTAEFGESRGGISPPRAPRTVREPLDSHGSRCSAVGTRSQQLCLVHGLLLLPVGFSWPVASVEQRSPFAPAPLQDLRHYYGLLRPCAPLRYSRPRGFGRLRLLPWHRRTGSHVPYKSQVELRAAYMPDATRTAFRTAPELVPGNGPTPGFGIV